LSQSIFFAARWAGGYHLRRTFGHFFKERALKRHETICSALAADTAEQLFGVGVASSSLAVGKSIPFSGAGAGAMAVQGLTSPYLGIEGMKLLRRGHGARDVIESVLMGDPFRQSRQLLVVDSRGGAAGFTGTGLPEVAGERNGDSFIVGGCGLSGEDLLGKCSEAFSSADGDLADKLLAALSVAASAEGNRAGMESAALRISKNDPFPYVDLRVDRHSEPVEELRRLLTLWRERNAPAEEPPAEAGPETQG